MSTTYSNLQQVFVPTVGGTQQPITISIDSELLDVLSSCIVEAEYWPESESLFVKFSNGDVYRYDDVEHSVAMTLEVAASAGRYFNQYIKGGHNYEKC